MNRQLMFYTLLLVLASKNMAHGQASHIQVGFNVNVSRAHEGYSIGEVLLSSDPTDANRLLGCAIIYSESENRRWTVVYLSTDAGNTWQSTLETKAYRDSWDPACTLSRNGLAFHIAIASNDMKHQILVLYRSSDRGQTWARQQEIPMTFQGIDRESIAIDGTGGQFDNRIYVTGQSLIPDLGGGFRNGFAIWRSRNGGMSLEGPINREARPGHYVAEPSNSVVLSDGTLVSIFGEIKHYDFSENRVPQSTPGEPNAVLEAVTATEGGDWLSEAIRVDDFFMVSPSDDLGTSTLGMPTLAVDSGDGPFHGRLYATWADERDGRSEIRFTYSADGGTTWSKSIVVDDVDGPAGQKDGPQNFLPTVAVNKAGVLAVTWYDRRQNPDGLGWFVRFRTSLDGGETWLPSVRVSEKANTFSSRREILTAAAVEQLEPSGDDMEIRSDGDKAISSLRRQVTENTKRLSVHFQGRQFYAGDYAGLAADASGKFHAFWIDDRTGVPQVWTAPIVVDGKAVRNGSVEFEKLQDISNEVELRIVSSNYDRDSSTVRIGICLINSSRGVIHGPLKLRLVNVSSALGNPSAVNADNHYAQPGAMWDLSSLLKHDKLEPGEYSAVKELDFRLDGPRELLDDKGIRYRLLDADVRVLAQ
jgi:hypothetical protein